jgi:hypothetical protein
VAFLIAVAMTVLLLLAGWAFIESAANPIAQPAAAAQIAGTVQAQTAPQAARVDQPGKPDAARPAGNMSEASPLARGMDRSAPAAADDSHPAWQAVERIDAKVANTLMLMTFFVAIIVVLLGLYEFFKLRELNEIELKIDKTVSLQVDKQFIEINKQYEKKLTGKLLGKIRMMTADIADDHLQLAAIGHRVLLSYVINDLPSKPSGTMSIESMRRYIELDRALTDLRIATDVDNLTGLSLLYSTSKNVGPTTAIALIQYLSEVRRMKLLSSWANQDLCDTIVGELEKETGVSAKDIEAAIAERSA